MAAHHHTPDLTADPAPADGAPSGGPEPSAPSAVVGLGASAGGVDALRTLLAGVPANSGLAWVVVMHLSPERESRLAELLAPHTTLAVEQVTETVRLERDRVYVIPPDAWLAATDSGLRVEKPEAEREDGGPIDHFFRTMAAAHGSGAVAVVLTGTGSDGARGLAVVKERGGLVVVQDPAEAEHDGMPRSALATELTDLVLPLERIGPAIVARTASRPRLEKMGEPAADGPPGREERLVGKLLAHLHARTGQDFGRYRRSTVLRRVARRMQLRGAEDLDAYLARLRADPKEVDALVEALLIRVTRFFRDPDLYEALARKVVPRLFDGKADDEGLRVWSVGCATGEEAYSLAILLLEEAERRGRDAVRARVFATDLHEPSLERAREGVYPADIEADVGEERLRRFFRKEPGGYRIRSEVRECVVFARHDLLSDPPYSRLDLISCRNVLIYLQPDLARDVVELFHYALRPGGFLALAREEARDWGERFPPVDDAPALYRRGEGPRPRLRVLGAGRGVGFHETPRLATGGAPPPAGVLHQRMVERYAPPSVLVGPTDQVIHVSEHAGRYLQPAPGDYSTRLDRLARPELRIALVAALRESRERGEPRSTPPISVALDDGSRPVVVHVRPALDGEDEGRVLVLFEERGPPEPRGDGSESAGGQATELEAELEWSRLQLLRLRAEHEETEKELRASNEELQSSNEELRAALEELETRGEELRRVNVELGELAEERQDKAEELETMSRDLQRLLVATEIGTLFLDHELCIVRYTPRIAHLFHARPSDLGRPLSDLKSRLRYEELLEDARAVLERAEAVEREVEDDEGRFYLARLLPHWGPREELDGVVAVFVDITTRKRLEEAEEESRVKSQFLSTMSHELRTPLTAVIGLADLMETDLMGPMNEKQKRNLARIKQSAWHLVRIIEEVLAFSRSEAGKEKVRMENMDLAKVAEEVIAMVEPTAERQEIELTLESGSHPVPVRTDAGKVRQIATNLVGNAVKFARGAVAVAIEEEEGWVALRVRDDGPGIPADRMEEIFEPFTQLDGSNTREKGGTGLGLTIARRQARLLGGDVSAESVEGEGSTFTLRLPRERTRPEGETE